MGFHTYVASFGSRSPHVFKLFSTCFLSTGSMLDFILLVGGGGGAQAVPDAFAEVGFSHVVKCLL